MNKIYLYLLTFLISANLIAQVNTKKADAHFERLEYVKAAEAYQKIVDRGNADDYVYLRLADSYYYVYKAKEAES
ncbi:MAG: cell envelope biogenesis protein OmpA, partial [Flavobacteriaceae bacterium]|nr:cell envelope biogenesis protein OmpA [Flavobacteriaceae bacterium]